MTARHSSKKRIIAPRIIKGLQLILEADFMSIGKSGNFNLQQNGDILAHPQDQRRRSLGMKARSTTGPVETLYLID